MLHSKHKEPTFKGRHLLGRVLSSGEGVKKGQELSLSVKNRRKNKMFILLPLPMEVKS